jgi:hypothetical protein
MKMKASEVRQSGAGIQDNGIQARGLERSIEAVKTGWSHGNLRMRSHRLRGIAPGPQGKKP